ncbi:STN domain-containing protein [Longitalea luteola]|uniref:STN domain-containing protein n=1 Tax=Longitalea luteola TaxID=2812563 RepID=UPI001A973AA0|nr:STN domain-containing protein [Longitalea luteola]
MTTLRCALPIIIALICITTTHGLAQSLLDRRISVEATNQRLSDVLKLISSKGNFYFSYNSSIITRDSIISISAYNRPVKQVLDQLCGNRYKWQQSNNYIILRKAPITSPAVVTSKVPSPEKLYTVSGIVLNSETGEKVGNVTIYEKQRLVSTMSDDKGYFKIKLKSRYSTASLTISREMFEDTTVVIQPKYDQQVTIVMTPVVVSEPVVTISPVENELPDTIVIQPPVDTFMTTAAVVKGEVNQVERTRWGKRLVSAKQKIQSINLEKFFADRPSQISLTPGLSTHGRLSAQVINNFSINVIGGYTAGVAGVELGGAFNINKKDVKYLQAAGLGNITGGSVTGVQLAGIHNHVLHDVSGLQAAGVSNYVKGNVTGVQLSSIHNHVSGSLTGLQAGNISNFLKGKLIGVQLSNIHNVCYDSVFGMQAANIVNFAHKKVSGVQLAAIANFANREMSGAQFGILNYAKKLRGFQAGLINISDTSAGYSIGLINIVLKGMHKLALSTNEVLDYNAAFKTGNKNLYSILLVGYKNSKRAGTTDTSSIISFGYGLGHEFSIGKWFSINPEFTSQYLRVQSWENANVMNKLHLQFNIKLGKYITLFGGPSFTAYYTEWKKNPSGLQLPVPASYHTFDLWDDTIKGWFGWNAGISLF